MNMILEFVHALILVYHLLAGVEYGTATVFWAKGDPGNPVADNACYLRAPHIPRQLNDRQLVVAHKSLPCGARVLVLNPRTMMWVIARKSDWGPRHALVDLSRATARAVKLNGMEPVVLVPF